MWDGSLACWSRMYIFEIYGFGRNKTNKGFCYNDTWNCSRWSWISTEKTISQIHHCRRCGGLLPPYICMFHFKCGMILTVTKQNISQNKFRKNIYWYNFYRRTYPYGIVHFPSHVHYQWNKEQSKYVTEEYRWILPPCVFKFDWILRLSSTVSPSSNFSKSRGE